MTDVCLIMDEVLEIELIVGYSIFQLEAGHFEAKKSIRSAEVIVPEDIFWVGQHEFDLPN